ncbi:hypothetical protein J6590_036429 [Homalodisca vitripennis]|nr:hypothetical protein J6590_036429 [Homalodisca vitripennis]
MAPDIGTVRVRVRVPRPCVAILARSEYRQTVCQGEGTFTVGYILNTRVWPALRNSHCASPSLSSTIAIAESAIGVILQLGVIGNWGCEDDTKWRYPRQRATNRVQTADRQPVRRVGAAPDENTPPRLTLQSPAPTIPGARSPPAGVSPTSDVYKATFWSPPNIARRLETEFDIKCLRNNTCGLPVL